MWPDVVMASTRTRSTQRTLFDQPEPRTQRLGDTPAPAFRNREVIASAGDPVTSHLAAAEITASGQRANLKAALLAWMREQRESLTSAEIAATSGFDRHGVARRLPDLAADGFVERCTERECRVNRRPSITWRVAERVAS